MYGLVVVFNIKSSVIQLKFVGHLIGYLFPLKNVGGIKE
jgi:hypothetical protein